LEHFPDSDWSGLEEFSLEDLLVKLVAEASALNGAYLDLRSNQAYLRTAQVYRDILRIAENIRSLSAREISGINNFIHYWF
jgi:hypothetical protein